MAILSAVELILFYTLILYTTATINIVTALLPESEVSALTARYHSTNGDDWREKGNWQNGEKKLRYIYGVVCKNSHVFMSFSQVEMLQGHMPQVVQASVGETTTVFQVEMLEGQAL